AGVGRDPILPLRRGRRDLGQLPRRLHRGTGRPCDGHSRAAVAKRARVRHPRRRARRVRGAGERLPHRLRRLPDPHLPVGGGLGIQADLKTFAALGVHGTSAITAVTAQNTVDVTEILELPTTLIRAQIDAVVSDLDVRAAKTGMLSSAEIIEAVANAISDHAISQLVVDPVMVAKGGARLLRDDAVEALRT